jgi:39S ribosomal protein L41, mitochondrial
LFFLFTLFSVPNDKGQFEAKHIPEPLFEDYYNYPIQYDPMKINHPGVWFRRKFVYVKEMEPELIVPDLTGFKLKPYVSYRTPEIEQPPLTANLLFNAIYGNDIINKYLKNEEIKVETSEEEIEEARLKHIQTGSDLFNPTIEELEEMTP